MAVPRNITLKPDNPFYFYSLTKSTRLTPFSHPPAFDEETVSVTEVDASPQPLEVNILQRQGRIYKETADGPWLHRTGEPPRPTDVSGDGIPLWKDILTGIYWHSYYLRQPLPDTIAEATQLDQQLQELQRLWRALEKAETESQTLIVEGSAAAE